MECEWIRTAEHDLAALRDAAGGVAVLPLASIESHGPHLPLGSDTLCVTHVARRVAEQETVALLPVLPYSNVAAAMHLPGAVHIDSRVLVPLVLNIADEAARNGFAKIVLLHGHGGNIALHQMLCLRVLELACPYAVYSIPPGAGMGDLLSRIMESRHTGHACEYETSMNLVVAPECVRMERVTSPPRTYEMQPHPDVGEALTPVEWVSRWPEMAVGKPFLATVEKGRQIMDARVRGVVEIIRRIKADRICPEIMANLAARRQAHRGGPVKG